MNQNLRYAMCCHYTQLSIYREKGARSPVCLRASLVPIFYHTIAVYSLSRETVMQGPLVIGDCYLGIIRIQTTSTGLSPAETTTTLPPRLYFCCMLITAFYTPYTNLTSSSHTTQPVSTGFIEWASVITTLHDFSHRFGRHPIESSQSCHRQ